MEKVSCRPAPPAHPACPALFHFLQERARLERFVRIERLGRNEFLLHDAVLVDHERRAIRDQLFVVPYAVALADIAARVAQDVELDAQLVGKRRVSPGAVDAHTQDDGVVGIELTGRLLILGHLARAAGRECRREKRQHDVLLPLEVAELD